jgi:phage/plasmid primase-like uncharacterized protein
VKQHIISVRRTVESSASDHRNDLRPELLERAEKLPLEHLQSWADRLGVSAESLWQLRAVPYSDGSLAVPMSDGAGQLVGWHLRRTDGRKLCIRGSELGLYLPRKSIRDAKELWVPEGPSDTAALLTLGLNVVGRATARSKKVTSMLVNLIKGSNTERVVIVADRDLVGIQGARETAEVLRHYCNVIVMVPPAIGVKDARDLLVRWGSEARTLLLNSLNNHCGKENIQ